ncbi:MAG: prepilin-type N-terminal cleavage/methylation domain-containing protein [Candidatus Eremiobacteraeota bacterium]|nr:prepilin-type N-terminal cleavage/methylation domain-containing protein [Candidatus Eremiobacteraeota bacterium]
MIRRGFTLLESLITIAVMGGLVLMVFAVFEVGVTGFKVGGNRLDLQGDLRRVLTPLRKDLQNSSFQSVSTVSVTADNIPLKPPNPSPAATVQRDGLCMNGLRNSQDDDSYDNVSGLPIWDCFVCYFATQDSPDGKMVRMLLRDPSRDTLGIPRPLSPSDLSLSNPDLLASNVRVLSDQIMEFGAVLDPANQLVRLHLKLRSKVGRQQMGGRSLVEILEIETTVDPANTNPRL